MKARFSLLFLLLAGPSFAQEEKPKPPGAPPPPGGPRDERRGQGTGRVLAGINFKAADKNADGSLSTEELSAAVFVRLDRNADGKLSPDELAAMPARPGPREGTPDGGIDMRTERTRALDRNGDGAVDASEFRLPPFLARRLDRDGDGRISAEEFRSGSAGRGEPETVQPPPSSEDPDGLLRRMDGDGDGGISRAEWKGEPAEFARMDGNGDGRIAGPELRGATPGPAAGAPVPGRPGRSGLFAGDPTKFDENRDGKLSGKEASAWFLSNLDRDGSGSLSKEEVSSLPFPPRYNTGKEGTGVDRLFQDLDHDRDGKISAKEFVLPEPLWNSVDRDRDGFLKGEELRPRGPREGPPGRRGRDFAGLDVRNVEDALGRMDGDKDGEVSRDEWKGPAQVFDRWDGDKDGKLARAELATGIERAKQAGLIREPNDFVARYDKDKDGRVTREEFDGPPEAFDRADSNGDGVVTAADRPAGDTPPPAETQRPPRRARF